LWGNRLGNGNREFAEIFISAPGAGIGTVVSFGRHGPIVIGSFKEPEYISCIIGGKVGAIIGSQFNFKIPVEDIGIEILLEDILAYIILCLFTTGEGTKNNQEEKAGEAGFCKDF